MVYGKEMVNIILEVPIKLEVYFALNFSANKIASYILSESLEVQISTTIRQEKFCLLFKRGSLNMDNLIFGTKFENGLFPVRSNSFWNTRSTLCSTTMIHTITGMQKLVKLLWKHTNHFQIWSRMSLIFWNRPQKTFIAYLASQLKYTKLQ